MFINDGTNFLLHLIVFKLDWIRSELQRFFYQEMCDTSSYFKVKTVGHSVVENKQFDLQFYKSMLKTNIEIKVSCVSVPKWM